MTSTSLPTTSCSPQQPVTATQVELYFGSINMLISPVGAAINYNIIQLFCLCWIKLSFGVGPDRNWISHWYRNRYRNHLWNLVPIPEPVPGSVIGLGPVLDSALSPPISTGTVAKARKWKYDHLFLTSPPLTSK